MIRKILNKTLSLLLNTSLVLLLVVAVYVSLGRQLLPYVVNYRADIEARLSAGLGQQMQIGSLTGGWSRFNPVVSLQQVRIFPPGSPESDQAIVLDNLSLELDTWSSLLERRWVLANVEVLNPGFTLTEQKDGGWQLQGFEAGADNTMTPDQLLERVSRVSSLVLSNMTISMQRHDGRTTTFERSRLHLQNRGQQHYVHLDAWQGDVAEPLSVAAELTGNSVNELSGLLYLLLPDSNYSELVAGPIAGLLNLHLFDGSGKLWLEIEKGQLQALQGNAVIKALNLGRIERGSDVMVEDLATRFFARRVNELSVTESIGTPAWEVLLEDLSFQSNGLSWAEGDIHIDYGPQESLHLLAEKFNLGIVTGLVSQFGVLSPDADAQLAEFNPRGELHDLELKLSLQEGVAYDPLQGDEESFSLAASLNDVAFSARGSAPALWGVDGYTELSYRRGAQTLLGTVEVESSRFMIQLPALFNDTWAYDHVNGRVQFSLDVSQGQHLKLTSGVIVAESAAVNGRAMFSTEFRNTTNEERSSSLELMVGALEADVGRKTLYLPTAPRVSDNLRNVMQWVEGAVLSGRAVESGVIFRGSTLAGSSPEDKTLQMYYNLENGALRFDPQWPVLENLQGNVVIKDRDVDIRVQSGQSLGIGFDATTASIRPNPDGQGSWLAVTGHGNGAAQQGLRYLQETPVTRGFGNYLADWEAQGSVALDLDLRIPLGIPASQPQVNVGFELQSNVLHIPEFALDFSELVGKLSYSTQGGLRGDQLSAVFFEQPVALNLRSEVDAGRSTSTVVELQGKAGMQVLHDWPLQSAFVQGILSRSEGQMDYLARLELVQPPVEQQVDAQRSLTITSNLLGVSLDLPAPLRKDADEELEFDLTMNFLDEQQDLRLTLGEVGTVNIRLEDAQVRNGLVFLGRRAEGVTARRLNANAPGLDVVGSLASFDYDAWMQALRAPPGEAPSAAASGTNFSQLRDAVNAVDVSIAQAHAFGQDVDNLNVQIASGDNDWELTLASEKVGGIVRVPYRSGEPLDVHLSHLIFPAPPEEEVPLADAGADLVTPIEGGVVETTDEEEVLVDPLLEFDPRSLPRMRFAADSILRGEADYGRWQFSLDPMSTGAEFTDLIVEARGLRAGREGEEARFVWHYDGTAHHSYLNAALDAGNFANVLSGFGYAPSIESTSAQFNVALDWPGSPAFFSTAGLGGALDLTITEGRFQQGATGAGSGALKLISIINFDALVRRLRFSDDLVRSGLSFEQIKGAMTISNGIVSIVDRLQIIGPASLFQVTGQLNLPEQTIDGSLYITLPLSDNIPWMSGIAVLNNLINWQLAVGVFLFDQIFGDQVDSLTSAQYTLQGPWEGLEPRLNQVFGNPAAAAGSSAPQTAPEAAPVPSPSTTP